MNWWKELKGKIKSSVSMQGQTTFKIGGPAEYFIEPRDIDDLKLLLNLTKRYNIPVVIIGAGSNILVNDLGLEGVVVRLNSPFFKRLSLRGNCLEVSSGVSLRRIISVSQNNNLSGLEFLVGIPGTVGGALVMNAGIPQRNIGDLVKDVTVMDYNGNIRTLAKKDIKFTYRDSNLSRFIVLSARIKLFKKNKKEIKEKIARYAQYRKNNQDLIWPSAGCVFRNPSRYSAGRLIDLCGLKGKKTGDACISQRHANFILNLGQAKASDVISLMELIKKEVKNKFHVTLKPEIKIWA